MPHQRQTRAALILGSLLAVGMLLGGMQLKRAVIAWKQAERYVSVKGLAERDVKVDLALWPLGFSVSAPTLDALHEALHRAEARVRDFLLRHGFSTEEMNAVSPTISDRWEHLFGDNRPTDRYHAEGVILLRTNRVDEVKATLPKVDELVKDGVLLGRNWEHRPQFIFTQLNDIKPAMIAEATQEARKAAQQFAEDSGSRVGKIKTANQGYFTVDDVDSFTPDVKRVRVVTTIEYLLLD